MYWYRPIFVVVSDLVHRAFALGAAAAARARAFAAARAFANATARAFAAATLDVLVFAVVTTTLVLVVVAEAGKDAMPAESMTMAPKAIVLRSSTVPPEI
jgi:hypothetical protein